MDDDVEQAALEHGRDEARRMVRTQLRALSLNPTDLARRAKVSVDTVTNFVERGAWPRPATQGALETVLGLEAGTLERTAEDFAKHYIKRQLSEHPDADPSDEVSPGSVGTDDDASAFVAHAGGDHRTPSGRSDAEILGMIHAARAQLEEIEKQLRDRS